MEDVHQLQLICAGGSETDFPIADKTIIDNYDANDWTGSIGKWVYWYSDTAGTQAEVVAPVVVGGINLSYFKAKDIKNTGAKIYCDATCIDGGNNSGIEFTKINDSNGLMVGIGVGIGFDD